MGGRTENTPSLGDPVIVTDDLGSCVSVSLDTTVYDKAVVFKVAYWYTDRCYVFFAPGKGNNKLSVELRAMEADGPPGNLENLAREFCNRLIDQQVRDLVATETLGVRDALVKKAFFEGSLHLDPSVLRSNESAVPVDGQGYKEDPLDIGKNGSG